MTLKKFKVVYRISSMSDLTSEMDLNASDEEDCRRTFERLNPGFVFVSCREEN